MTIAVAHNESAEGQAALVHAIKEAAFKKTNLLVLHILDDSDAVATDSEAAAIRTDIQARIGASGFADTQWELRTAAGGHSTAGALLDLTIDAGAELLVLGSRRRSVIGRFLLGSMVQRVVLDSPVPVLVVKAPPDLTVALRP